MPNSTLEDHTRREEVRNTAQEVGGGDDCPYRRPSASRAIMRREDTCS